MTNVIDFAAYKTRRGSAMVTEDESEVRSWDWIYSLPLRNRRNDFLIEEFEGMFWLLRDSGVVGEPLRLLIRQIEWFIDHPLQTRILDASASEDEKRALMIMQRMDAIRAHNLWIKYEELNQ